MGDRFDNLQERLHIPKTALVMAVGNPFDPLIERKAEKWYDGEWYELAWLNQVLSYLDEAKKFRFDLAH